MSGPHKLSSIEVDVATLPAATAEIEHQRRVAIFDLVEQNSFTPEGAEVAARCKALKHWLEDFTRLKEAVPGDLVLWNKLLVMGAALGVSKEVLRQLAEAVPPEVR